MSQECNGVLFKAITFFPDGSVYDDGKYCSDDYIDNINSDIADNLTFELSRRKVTIPSPIGDLDLIWTSFGGYAIALLFKDGKLVNTILLVPGRSEEENEHIEHYVNTWRSADVVKELVADSESMPFDEVFSIQDRPLMVSMNWATLKPEEYNKIANYDLEIASYYFSKIQQSA